MRIAQWTAAVAAAFGLALPVSSHVRVFPDANNQQIPACTFATFVVRVPVEKNVATNRIDVSIPKGVIVFGVQPKPGWQFKLERTKGIVTMISWSGGRLLPEEFDLFAFLAATPKAAGPIAWNALQYYEDGSVVRWTGAPGSETPHSITQVTKGTCTATRKRG
jgi:uncharacterized protein YcnI